MNSVTRPLPKADEFDTAAFWQATKNKDFCYQQCDSCNTIVFYPRSHCTGCIEGKLEWKTSNGKARVYSFSIVRQSYHPFFRSQAPYAVAWIDLDEGPRILSNIVGISADDIEVNMAVRIKWEEHETLNIPLFEPDV